MMPDEFAFQLNGFDVAIVHFADYARFGVVGEQSKFVAKIYGVHAETSMPRTNLMTAARTCCVVLRRDVSEYTRKRFSVPDARTMTQPRSSRYTLTPSIFSRREIRQSPRRVVLSLEKCATALSFCAGCTSRSTRP